MRVRVDAPAVAQREHSATDGRAHGHAHRADLALFHCLAAFAAVQWVALRIHTRLVTAREWFAELARSPGVGGADDFEALEQLGAAEQGAGAGERQLEPQESHTLSLLLHR